MDSNNLAIDQQDSPPIPQYSNYSFFSELARQAIDQPPSIPIRQFSSNYSYLSEIERRVGYLGPELGWTQHELSQCHHHYPPTHGHCLPPPHPLDMQAVIEREVETERIREDIITSEIARSRVLEAEVRELMMERELTMQRGSNGFPFASLPAILSESPRSPPYFRTRLEERFLVEIIAMLLEERKRLIGMRESGGLDTLPFQRGTADPRIYEVKAVMEEGKEKEKINLLAKPDTNISESKRKSETLTGVGANELSFDGFLKKKAKQEWSCALCQVSAFSERELNEHLCGRKHKKAEAKLRGAESSNKNYRIGFFPKEPTNSKSAAESSSIIMTRATSLKNDNLSSLQENLNPHSEKKDRVELTQIVQRNKKTKKKRNRANKRSRNSASEARSRPNDDLSNDLAELQEDELIAKVASAPDTITSFLS